LSKNQKKKLKKKLKKQQESSQKLEVAKEDDEAGTKPAADDPMDIAQAQSPVLSEGKQPTQLGAAMCMCVCSRSEW